MVDLFEQIINHPGFWIAIILAILYFIFRELNKGKLKPEQKPDFGVKYRKQRVDDHLKKRDKHFSHKPTKAHLLRDFEPLGRILHVEEIPRGKIFLYSITYRRYGFFNWLMSLMGFSRRRILVDDQHVKKVFDDTTKRIQYMINKNIYFRERGGLLILSNVAEANFVDDINSDKDYDNIKGFVSDFTRRLSNLHPAHAAKTDTIELESDLEERAENKKRSIWGGR